MSLILCVESSVDFSSVCIARDGKLVLNHEITKKFSHSKYLAPAIDELMNKAKIKFDDLDAISISEGPGSFTALRVGTSLVKGICYIHDIPLIAINTLDIIAKPFEKEGFDLLIPTIDARRNEAYISVIDNKDHHLVQDQPHIFTWDSFKEYQSKSILICGNAANKAKDLINTDHTINYSQTEPKAVHMIELTEAQLHDKNFADVAYFSPNYVKPPNITTPKKKLIP